MDERLNAKTCINHDAGTRRGGDRVVVHPNPAVEFSQESNKQQTVKTSGLRVFLSHLIFPHHTLIFSINLLSSCFMSIGTLTCSSDDTNLGAAMHTTPRTLDVA